MRIQVGQPFPSLSLKRLGANGPEDVNLDSLLRGRRVVIFTVVGAFTPGCSRSHLPGFIAEADAIKAAGIDEIVCVAVNDVWVMGAWGDSLGAAGKVTLLADGNADLARALGLELDLSVIGFGVRCTRSSMVVDDGIVTELNVEPGRDVGVSGAEHCLAMLR